MTQSYAPPQRYFKESVNTDIYNIKPILKEISQINESKYSKKRNFKHDEEIDFI